MTYYGAAELAAAFRTVRGNTLKIAEEIPEDKYQFVPAEGCRTVEKLLTHIALGTRFQMQVHVVEQRSTLEGMDFPGLFQKLTALEAQSRTKAQVIELLKSEGEEFAKFLDGVSEAFLAGSVGMPAGATPATKSRFEMLTSAKEHEMHHRGQLMTIERMLGIVPHLTREMEARFAQMMQAAAKQPA